MCITPAHVHLLHTCPPRTYILKHLMSNPPLTKILGSASSEGHYWLEVCQKVWDTVPRAQSILSVCHWMWLPACSSEKHRDPRTHSPSEHQSPKSHSHHLVNQTAKWETTERHMVILSFCVYFSPLNVCSTTLALTAFPACKGWLNRPTTTYEKPPLWWKMRRSGFTVCCKAPNMDACPNSGFDRVKC